MTVKATYTARGHKIEGMRFVRACYEGAGKPHGYRWIIRSASDLRYDLQQGICDADDLPAEIRAQADSMIGNAFSYVGWPR